MNSIIKIFLITFLSGWISFIHGQYIFKTLNEEKGLTSDQVKCMIKDRDGFIWLGTLNGLCRFDGSEITTFQHSPSDSNSLCDNEIRSLYQDYNGLIWIGTVRGISTYCKDKNQFSGFFHDPADPLTLSNNKIQFITGDPAGNILIATDGNGLDIYDPVTRTFSHHLPSDQVNIKPARFVNTFMGFAHDPSDDQVIWFGTQIGLLKFNIETKEFFHFYLDRNKSNNPALISERENLIRDILFDENGKLWLATWGGGLCHFNPADERYEIYKYEPLHPVNGYRNNIGKLHWKTRNEIWILAPHKGVSVFNTETHEFTFLVNDNLQELEISPSEIITDDHGFIWISSYTSGLLFANENAHQFNKQPVPYPLKGIAVCNSNPEVIFTGVPATYGKLVVYDTHANTYSTYDYTPYNDQSENYFQNFFCDNNRLWLIESYNLYYWDYRQKEIKLYSEFDPVRSKVSEASMVPFLISGCQTSTGELWIGTTFNGIFRIIPSSGEVLNYYYPDSLAGNIYLKDFIFTIFPDSKGRVWYGSTDFGYFDPETQQFVNLSLGRDFPDAPVKSSIVRAFTETPDGHIWLGTINSGIQVIDPNDPVSFIGSFASVQGLAGSLIVDMLTDDAGDVWVITDKGLSRIRPSTGKVENYGNEYGLTHLKQLTKLNNGKIAVVADWGIHCFYPDSIQLMSHDLKPYFKFFRIFDRIIEMENMLSANKQFRLKPEENFFSIEYGAINFFNPDMTEFSYILEGFDQQWIHAGKRKYVSYTNLPGGTYTFRLRASDGTEHIKEITMSLSIGTPFWKTLWFYVLITVLVAAFLYGIYHYRMRQVRKQEEIKSKYDKMIGQLEMKALRAQMNPHFLFNSLNSIRYYILKEEFDNASEYLTKFSKLLRLILSNSRQNMITLREELETLNIYIGFEQMRFNKSFEYIERISSSVNPEEIMLQPMTIQPFIENAIWHGLMPKEDNRKLNLSISLSDRMLTIIVEDNGVGRVKAKSLKQVNDMSETKSYGLQITTERFAILQGIRDKRSDFEITDLYDDRKKPAGTRVTINYEI